MRHQRGRRSADDNIIPIGPQYGDRPNAPSRLSDREAAEWDAIVQRMPPQAFPTETHGMLTALVAIKIGLDDVNEELRKFGPGIPKSPKKWSRYKELIRLRGQFASQLGNLATKLRITPQSKYDKWKAAQDDRRQGQTTRDPWTGYHQVDSNRVPSPGGRVDQTTSDAGAMAEERSFASLRQSSNNAPSDPVVRTEERQDDVSSVPPASAPSGPSGEAK